MKKLLLLSIALGLAACDVARTTDTGVQESFSFRCGADQHEDLVGQPQSVLRSREFPSSTRFIFPGMPVTLDFNPERLNFDISSGGTVSRAWCG